MYERKRGSEVNLIAQSILVCLFTVRIRNAHADKGLVSYACLRFNKSYLPTNV